MNLSPFPSLEPVTGIIHILSLHKAPNQALNLNAVTNLNPVLLFLICFFYLLFGGLLWHVVERAVPGGFRRLPFLLLWPLVLIVSLFVVKKR